MRTTTATLAIIALIATAPASAGVPKKCVNDDGSVTYSNNRTCPGGERERIDSGTFSTSKSQTIKVIELEFSDIYAVGTPTVRKDPNQKPPITTPIPQ